MQHRLLCVLAVSPVVVSAQTPAPGPGDLRRILDDRDGNLTALAQQMLGANGGNQLFYLPTRDQPATPENWGFDFEDVEFASADGTKLHGWFLPARGSARGTVVFSHGNAGSLGHHLGFAMWMVEAGYQVFMYDYRGFGKSGGGVDRRGMIHDVRAAFDYVSARADVDSNKLVSYGHSLGGAKSITALAENPVEGLRAVIVDGAFSSYQGMAKIIGGQLGANLVTDEWAPKDFVGKLPPVPLLVVHGAEDEVVPISHGRELFEAAKQPKTIFEVKNGRHGDALSRDNGAYRKRLIEWLGATLEG